MKATMLIYPLNPSQLLLSAGLPSQQVREDRAPSASGPPWLRFPVRRRQATHHGRRGRGIGIHRERRCECATRYRGRHRAGGFGSCVCTRAFQRERSKLLCRRRKHSGPGHYNYHSRHVHLCHQDSRRAGHIYRLDLRCACLARVLDHPSTHNLDHACFTDNCTGASWRFAHCLLAVGRRHDQAHPGRHDHRNGCCDHLRHHHDHCAGLKQAHPQRESERTIVND